MRLRARRVAAVCGIVVIVAGALYCFSYVGTYVSRESGRLKVVYGIGSVSGQMGIRLWTRYEETALSGAMPGGRQTEEHRHAWVFAHGGGLLSRASGGGIVLRINCQSNRVATFVGAVYRSDSLESAKAWRKRILDPDEPVHFDLILDVVGFESEMADDLQLFSSWWAAAEPELREICDH